MGIADFDKCEMLKNANYFFGLQS